MGVCVCKISNILKYLSFGSQADTGHNIILDIQGSTPSILNLIYSFGDINSFFNKLEPKYCLS